MHQDNLQTERINRLEEKIETLEEEVKVLKKKLERVCDKVSLSTMRY